MFLGVSGFDLDKTSFFIFKIEVARIFTVKKRQNAVHTYPADLTRGLQREERAIDHRPAEAKHRPVIVPLATGNANGQDYFSSSGVELQAP